MVPPCVNVVGVGWLGLEAALFPYWNTKPLEFQWGNRATSKERRVEFLLNLQTQLEMLPLGSWARRIFDHTMWGEFGRCWFRPGLGTIEETHWDQSHCCVSHTPSVTVQTFNTINRDRTNTACPVDLWQLGTPLPTKSDCVPSSLDASHFIWCIRAWVHNNCAVNFRLG